MNQFQVKKIENMSIRIHKSQGETIRKWLLENGYLAIDLIISRDGNFLYFPISSDGNLIKLKLQQELSSLNFELLSHEFDTIQRTSGDYRDHLVDFPEHLFPLLPSSFDIIGNILIIKIQKEIFQWKELVASALLKAHNQIHSVFQDAGVEGTYRIRNLIHLAGKPDTITIHKEYGMRFKVDVARVYFSPRLANERNRIAQMVKNKENILDMFAGVGPFSIAIEKQMNNSTIYAIDQNPDAYKLMKENITLNKIERVEPFLGDSRIIVRELAEETTFDRIIMNLPHNSLDFLELALNSMVSGTIHIYDIANREEIPIHSESIQNTVESKHMNIKNLETIEIKAYSPADAFFVHDLIVSD